MYGISQSTGESDEVLSLENVCPEKMIFFFKFRHFSLTKTLPDEYLSRRIFP